MEERMIVLHVQGKKKVVIVKQKGINESVLKYFYEVPILDYVFSYSDDWLAVITFQPSQVEG